MMNLVKIAAKWDDTDGEYRYNVLIDGKFIAEHYSEEAAYSTAFQQLGAKLEVEYD